MLAPILSMHVLRGSQNMKNIAKKQMECISPIVLRVLVKALPLGKQIQGFFPLEDPMNEFARTELNKLPSRLRPDPNLM